MIEETRSENLLVLHNFVPGQKDVDLGVVIGLGDQSGLI